MMTNEAIPLVGADVYMRMGDCLFQGIGTDREMLPDLSWAGYEGEFNAGVF